ncbi:MAG: dihydroneopterin aldolase [Flavobacteriales bacterium]|jgi:dihydroneopterin aldolase|nr:dihydroneopterin aldolase [Flavobacteriales bacterium]
MNIIRVYGIRTYSFHGCLPEETQIGGDFEVDVDLWVDFKAAAANDDLQKTINYVEVNVVVEEEMAVRADLIETVAYRIVNRLKKAHKQIEKIRVEIRKINPPLDGDVKFVSVIVEE